VAGVCQLPAALRATVEIADRCKFRSPLARRTLTDQRTQPLGPRLLFGLEPARELGEQQLADPVEQALLVAFSLPTAESLQTTFWSARKKSAHHMRQGSFRRWPMIPLLIDGERAMGNRTDDYYPALKSRKTGLIEQRLVDARTLATDSLYY